MALSDLTVRQARTTGIRYALNGDYCLSLTNIPIQDRDHDLGNGLLVRRSLPSRTHSSIGPFVFLDRAGPAVPANGNREFIPLPDRPA